MHSVLVVQLAAMQADLLEKPPAPLSFDARPIAKAKPTTARAMVTSQATPKSLTHQWMRRA